MSIYASILARSPEFLVFVLRMFKGVQVHSIRADGTIFTKLLGCLACLYSWVGKPSRGSQGLAASCVSPCISHVAALAPQHGTHRGTCPLARLSACLSSEKPSCV